MAISTATAKNDLASTYGQKAVSVALYSTVPAGTAGTEITGAGYSRQTPVWSAPVAGVSTAVVTFSLPAGVTVRGAGLYNAAGTYYDGGAVTEQPFATPGAYGLNLTFTEA